MTALVQRYRGRIEGYELWNEPDQGFTGSLAELVAMTGRFANVIRSMDRDALVVAPAPVKVEWHDAFWIAGGTKDVDAVAFHGYLSPPVPEDLNAKKVAPLRAIMVRNGMGSKPIWDSESSWGEPWKLTDPQEQAAYLARAYLLHWSCRVNRYYWYSWDDTNADGAAGWGALTDPGSREPTPAGVAYQQVRNWMEGATMTSLCAESTDSTWACTLMRPGYRAMAVWNTATTTLFMPRPPPWHRALGLWSWAPQSLPPRSPFTQYRDLAGHVHQVRGAIPIGKQPILLETTDIAQ